MKYLLGGGGQCRDQFGHDGLDLGVALVQMLGERAHEDDHTLADRVVAGILRGVLQELLENRQQGDHIVLVEVESCERDLLQITRLSGESLITRLKHIQLNQYIYNC